MEHGHRGGHGRRHAVGGRVIGAVHGGHERGGGRVEIGQSSGVGRRHAVAGRRPLRRRRQHLVRRARRPPVAERIGTGRLMRRVRNQIAHAERRQARRRAVRRNRVRSGRGGRASETIGEAGVVAVAEAEQLLDAEREAARMLRVGRGRRRHGAVRMERQRRVKRANSIFGHRR